MYDDRARNDARKLLELAPTLAFNRRARQDGGRLSAEVLSMKEEGSGKELEALLREALNSGLETPRGGGGTPIHQLKTVPLTVQTLPKRAPSIEEPSRDSVPGLAKKLAPNSVPPKPQAVKASAAAQAKGKSKGKEKESGKVARAEIGAAPERRSSGSALFAIGFIALAAAGGAIWFAQKHQMGPLATTAPPTAQAAVTPAATTSVVEGAVGIAVVRPPDAPTSPPATIAASTPAAPAPEPPPPATKPEEPRPPATLTLGGSPPPVTKAAEPKVVQPKEDPKPAPRVHHASAAPKPEPKPEKAAAPTPPTPAPAPAPAPAAGGVDALLQQQLKGAIP
jgi:hypothetical protein